MIRSDKNRSSLYSRKYFDLQGGCPKIGEKNLNFPSMFSPTPSGSTLKIRSRIARDSNLGYKENDPTRLGRGRGGVVVMEVGPSRPVLSYRRLPPPVRVKRWNPRRGKTNGLIMK